MSTQRFLATVAATLLAGCVTEVGSGGQALYKSGDTPERTATCFYSIGDFTQADPRPGSTTVNLGTDQLLTAELDAPFALPSSVLEAVSELSGPLEAAQVAAAPVPGEYEALATNLLVTRVLDAAVVHPHDVQAVFLAEYVTAQLNVEAGAPLSSADVDLLVAADEAVRTDGYDADASLTARLQNFNRSLAIEAPCFVESTERLLDGI